MQGCSKIHIFIFYGLKIFRKTPTRLLYYPKKKRTNNQSESSLRENGAFTCYSEAACNIKSVFMNSLFLRWLKADTKFDETLMEDVNKSSLKSCRLKCRSRGKKFN